MLTTVIAMLVILRSAAAVVPYTAYPASSERPRRCRGWARRWSGPSTLEVAQEHDWSPDMNTHGCQGD